MIQIQKPVCVVYNECEVSPLCWLPTKQFFAMQLYYYASSSWQRLRYPIAYIPIFTHIYPFFCSINILLSLHRWWFELNIETDLKWYVYEYLPKYLRSLANSFWLSSRSDLFIFQVQFGFFNQPFFLKTLPIVPSFVCNLDVNPGPRSDLLLCAIVLY